MSKLRILEIGGCGTIGTDRMGPVSKVTFELSTALHEIGHEVVVADAPAVDRKLTPPVLEIDVPARHTDDVWVTDKHFVGKLLAEHDLSQYDIIHSHEWQTCHLFHQAGIRTVYTSHTPTWISYRGLRLAKDWIRRFVSPHEYRIIRQSLLTVALGDYLKVPGANIAVIPSGVHLQAWNPAPQRSEGFNVLFVGRIDPIKGVHVLLDALRTLTFDYRAVIVGSFKGNFRDEGVETPYAIAVRKQAEGLPVHFTGFLSNRSPQFRQRLADADVFVVPSLFEPQGLVVLEALASGLPVIGSDVGGIGMMLNDKVGRLVPPGDALALAAALSELHGNVSLRHSMSIAARRHVENNFSWRTCANAYAEAMQRSLAGK